jgi:hypothetical protein
MNVFTPLRMSWTKCAQPRLRDLADARRSLFTSSRTRQLQRSPCAAPRSVLRNSSIAPLELV